MVTYPYFVKSKENQHTQYGIDFFSGFYNAHNIIKGANNQLQLNIILQKLEFIPSEEAKLLEYLNNTTNVQKSKLALYLGISGKNLNDLLARLQKEKKIKIDILKSKNGRPSEIVNLIS